IVVGTRTIACPSPLNMTGAIQVNRINPLGLLWIAVAICCDIMLRQGVCLWRYGEKGRHPNCRTRSSNDLFIYHFFSFRDATKKWNIEVVASVGSCTEFMP